MNLDNNEDILMSSGNLLEHTNNSIELNEKTKKIKVIDETIYITELTDKIAQIIKSPNKNDFIKKYNESHNQIKKVDEILYSPNTLDPNIDIKVLFEMLKEYEILIEKGDITIEEYKSMCDLVELIENKLKNLSMDVKEI